MWVLFMGMSGSPGLPRGCSLSVIVGVCVCVLAKLLKVTGVNRRPEPSTQKLRASLTNSK